MSGFFSLEPGIRFGKVHHHHQNQDQDHDHEHDDGTIISPYSLHLFKNEEINGRSFELWQQYYQHHQQPPSSSGSKVMRQGGYGGIGGGSGGGSSGGMNCQDCGNQAKKDCQHMRCRTCCKSRGLPCQTHVKSTWVPAAKRRERQQQLMSVTQQNSTNVQQLSLMMRDGATGSDQKLQNSKRLREFDDHRRSITVAGNRSTAGGGGGGVGTIFPASQHHNTSSGLEVGNFPAEVSSPAVFRCVRVSAMDEAEEQLAYQTALSIGGHVFKGILYDHGPESRYHHSGEGSSSGGGAVQNLITSGTAAEASGINPSASFVDASSTYQTPFSAFMAGTQFFPPPRS